jgi:hypothetical protein
MTLLFLERQCNQWVDGAGYADNRQMVSAHIRPTAIVIPGAA